jgi:hypothetical protein
MSPHIRCACGQVLPLADEPCGRNIECPGCGAPHYVPNLASVVALSNARGQRVGQLRFEPDRMPETLPFLDDPRQDQDDDERYEPPTFGPRRPR